MIELLACEDCGAVQQPRRAVCRACLSDRLAATPVAAGGVLLAKARIHRSLEPAFTDRLPVSIGTVKLDAGPVVFAFVPERVEAGRRVQLALRADGGTARFYVEG